MAITKVTRTLLSTGIVDNSNATAITIDSSENVGIGTTSPGTQLTLNKNDNNFLQIRSSDTGNAGIYFGRQNDSVRGAIVYDNSNESIQFLNNNYVERMRIDSSGNVQVGTTSNASGRRLHIEQSGTLGQLGLRNSGATSGKLWHVGPNGNNHFILYNNSIVGLYVLDGGTSWTAASDENLKENIVELTGALDKVKDYRCVEYNLISDETNSKKIGFIAQDWQEDYSQVVSQDPDGNLGMQYTETIPVLLKAIQEQQTIIDDLKTRIEALEG